MTRPHECQHRLQLHEKRYSYGSVLPQFRRDKINMTGVLRVILAVTMAVVTCRETFGQMPVYTVSDISDGGVPSRLNNLGDVAGKAGDSSSGETLASIWQHGRFRGRKHLGPKHLGKLHGGESSSASGINDAGEVAGEANTAESNR